MSKVERCVKKRKQQVAQYLQSVEEQGREEVIKASQNKITQNQKSIEDNLTTCAELDKKSYPKEFTAKDYLNYCVGGAVTGSAFALGAITQSVDWNAIDSAIVLVGMSGAGAGIVHGICELVETGVFEQIRDNVKKLKLCRQNKKLEKDISFNIDVLHSLDGEVPELER